MSATQSSKDKPIVLKPSLIKAARDAARQARQELEYFGASEDFTRSPIDAALTAFVDALLADDEVQPPDRQDDGVAVRSERPGLGGNRGERVMAEVFSAHACNNPTCHCQATLRAERVVVVPHVWTIPEIKALPDFGNEHGWFYGLVKVEYKDDDETGVEIAEILPGLGWTSIDPPNVAAAWQQIQHDLRSYRP